MRRVEMLLLFAVACGADKSGSTGVGPTTTSPGTSTGATTSSLTCTDVAPPNATSEIVAVPAPADCSWTCDEGFGQSGEICAPRQFCYEGWCVETGTPTTDGLWAVWGESVSDPWVGSDFQTVFQWSGGTWSGTSLGVNALTAMRGTSNSDVWAVGQDLHHWDGGSWTSYALDPGIVQHAHDLWTDGSVVWAVGERDFPGDAAVFEFDGAAFVPQTLSTDGPLRHIAGTSTSDLWASGDDGLYTYDGANWVWVTSYADGPCRGIGVLSTGEVVCAGQSSVARWDGVGWTDEPIDEGLKGIGATGDDLFGYSNDALYRREASGSWVLDMALDIYPTSIGGTSDGIILGGADGEILTRSTGGTVDTLHTGERSWTTDGCALADDDIWRVGDTNAITYPGGAWHFDGTEWLNTGAPGLRGLSCAGGVVVGAAEDDLYVWDGLAWTGMLAPGFDHVDVAASSADNVWSLDRSGLVRQWDGAQWIEHDLGVPLYDIATVDSNNAWVGTDFPTKVLHWNGVDWQPVDVGPLVGNRVDAIVAHSTGDVWVKSDWSFVQRFNGATWNTIDISGYNQLFGSMTPLPSGGVGIAGYGTFLMVSQAGVVQPHDIPKWVEIVLERSGEPLVFDRTGGVLHPE